MRKNWPISRIDFRIIPIVLALMIIGFFVIASMSKEGISEDRVFWTSLVKSQARWFLLGWVVFFLSASFDYRYLRSLSPFFYFASILLLIGLFFVSPIQNVHRWYKIFGLGSFQPSEQAKIAFVCFLGWFLERKSGEIASFKTAFQVALITLIPFFLIVKQPDLGTALIFYPIALAVGYVAGIHKGIFRVLSSIGLCFLTFVTLIFTDVLEHEQMRPFFTKLMKEYQYERLNPHTYHQRASQIAIGSGGVFGKGWQKSDFSSKKWLPASHTDSVFAAFGEEFGLLGLSFLLFLFYSLLYFCFQAAAFARDLFGRFLATGLAVYLAMHVLINIGMMCGLFPISGVPLLFVTYGGSSILSAMLALGLIQSVYSRRFMF